jgi:sigma-E factor negative regulatory protein RseA
MSEEILNRVSAFADGECSETESRAALASLNNAETRATWSRYQLIGDAMRGDMPRFIDGGFAGRVQQALALEPAILAPVARQPAWLRPVAGVAIAATVAAVAVFGVGQRAGVTTAPDGIQSAMIAKPPVNDVAVGVIDAPPVFMEMQSVPVAVGRTPMDAGALINADEAWMQASSAAGSLPPAHSRLNSYIMNYSEQRTMMGSPGVLPYAKVVGYTPDR